MDRTDDNECQATTNDRRMTKMAGRGKLLGNAANVGAAATP